MKLTIEVKGKYFHMETGDIDDMCDEQATTEEGEYVRLPFGFTAIAGDEEDEEEYEETVRSGRRR